MLKWNWIKRNGNVTLQFEKLKFKDICFIKSKSFQLTWILGEMMPEFFNWSGIRTSDRRFGDLLSSQRVGPSFDKLLQKCSKITFKSPDEGATEEVTADHPEHFLDVRNALSRKDDTEHETVLIKSDFEKKFWS